MKLYQRWLPLVNCCLMLCTVGLYGVAQEANVDEAPTSNSQLTDSGAIDSATESDSVTDSLAAEQAAVDLPPSPAARPALPRASRPALRAEDLQLPAASAAALDAEPSADAGIRSSTWSKSQDQPTVNRELSVEPGTLPLLPADAPAWVGALPDLSDDVHRLFVGGEVAESESAAAEGLDTPLVMAVRTYVERDVLQHAGAGHALAAKLTADYVWKNLIDQRSGYMAKLNTPGQPMYQKWVTVSVTPEQRGEILGWHREALQRERLTPIGLGLTSLLGCVGLMHLILRRKPRGGAAGE